MLDLGGYERLLTNIDTLVERSASLLELANLQADFDYSLLIESLPKLQQFLKDNGPVQIVEE